mmetsp:Transcript_30998/g.61131  ORF Transcript_30998/g.61131 Transcript_30998/m.61131 type:complete len:106 (-) Transcript_30998:1366-1683(-)
MIAEALMRMWDLTQIKNVGKQDACVGWSKSMSKRVRENAWGVKKSRSSEHRKKDRKSIETNRGKYEYWTDTPCPSFKANGDNRKRKENPRCYDEGRRVEGNCDNG